MAFLKPSSFFVVFFFLGFVNSLTFYEDPDWDGDEYEAPDDWADNMKCNTFPVVWDNKANSVTGDGIEAPGVTLYDSYGCNGSAWAIIYSAEEDFEKFNLDSRVSSFKHN